jgi:hypothetical protein
MHMSWIENSLTRLETTIRAIIEGDTAVDGIPRKFHNQLVEALVSAMQSGLNKVRRENEPEVFIDIAPDQYTLVMPADQAKILLSHPTELDRLAHKLVNTAAQANLLLAAPPIIHVVGSPDAKQTSVQAVVSHTGMGDSYTTELEQMSSGPRGSANLSIPKAFLIVNGLSTFPLVTAVTNIGSDTANQLVLKDPGVSGKHAQLRLINDRFTIFDLDSRGGTFVNGVPVSSQVLNPGDVILLAGVPLVYGLETASLAGYTQKLPSDQHRPEVL